MIGFLWIDNSQKNSINVKKKGLRDVFNLFFVEKNAFFGRKSQIAPKRSRFRMFDSCEKMTGWFLPIICTQKLAYRPKNKVMTPPPYIGRRAKKSNWILADNRLQQKLFFYIFVMQGTILSYCNVKEFAIVKLTPNRHSLVYTLQNFLQETTLHAFDVYFYK